MDAEPTQSTSSMADADYYKELWKKFESKRKETEEQLKQHFPNSSNTCHIHLFRPVQFRTDQTLATQDPLTNPNNRFHPTDLRQWDGFPRLQQEAYRKVSSLFHASQNSPTPFTSRTALESLGLKHCRRVLASELHVRTYARVAIEDQVQDILTQLQSLPDPSNFFPTSHLHYYPSDGPATRTKRQLQVNAVPIEHENSWNRSSFGHRIAFLACGLGVNWIFDAQTSSGTAFRCPQVGI